ncbi:amino acid permease [Shigella flexneri]
MLSAQVCCRFQRRHRRSGPGGIMAYLFAGLLVVMIMRMLAEMAVATPDTGSFSTYADKAIGRWAGYTIGWLYWWFWVLVIPLEATSPP